MSDEDLLHSHVLKTIGTSPTQWPGGWPNEIEAALIDAVFSVRARYGSRERKTGVYGAVLRWRAHRGEPADDLRILAQTSEDLLRGITNGGKIGRRRKADVVIDAARALADVDVIHARDFGTRQVAAREAYLSVNGCGPVTWSYFRMLLDFDDVKPDTWVMRFIQDELPNVSTPAEASTLVTAVAARLGVQARQLDHAIWRYRRDQPRKPI